MTATLAYTKTHDKARQTAMFVEFAQDCVNTDDFLKRLAKVEDDTEKGDIFEGFAKLYFECEPAYEFDKVEYMPKNAEGIDLIGVKKKTKTPIQVKFRSSERLSNDDLNSFGKKNFLGDYKQCYIFGNLRDVGEEWKACGKKVGLVLKQTLLGVDLRTLLAKANGQTCIYSSLTPRGFQPEQIKELKAYIADENRMKVISPCGTGKGLLFTYAMEYAKNKYGCFFAPTIRLVNDTCTKITRELTARGFKVRVMIVNSGNAVTDEMFHAHSAIVPTNDYKKIREFVKAGQKNKNKKVLYYIFACYQSSGVIEEACKGMKLGTGLFDEAHNVAGHESKYYQRLLHNRYFKFGQRIFATASEYVYRGDLDCIVGMNDEKIFGGYATKRTIRQAIEAGMVKDYRIVLAGMAGKELEYWWESLQENLFVCDDGEPVTMYEVFLKAFIYKMFADYPITRMVSGHNLIKNAKRLSEFLAKEDAITRYFKFVVKATWVSSEETESTNNDRIYQFANSQERSVLCAPPMLKEGIDIQGVNGERANAVVFCDTKRGEIGIIQLGGRGTRIENDKKDELCYIGIPVLYKKTADQEEIFNEGLEKAKEVLATYATNDILVEQEIKGMRVGRKPAKKYIKSNKVIEVPEIIAENINFNKFVSALGTKVYNAMSQILEKASYEEHLIECKKYKTMRQYSMAKKDNRFYVSGDLAINKWPKLQREAGWFSPDFIKTYKSHVRFAKKFKTGTDYSKAMKPNGYLQQASSVSERFSKDFFRDCGWRMEKKATLKEHIAFGKRAGSYQKYVSLAKKNKKMYAIPDSVSRIMKVDFPTLCGWNDRASYKEHIVFGKKFSSGAEYTQAKKSKRYYASPEIVSEVFSKDFYKDCGWINIFRKASYTEHIKLCKRYKNAFYYKKAKKDSIFYSSVSKMQRRWPKKNIYADAGWFNRLERKASYKEHLKECKKYQSGSEYNRTKKAGRFYAITENLKVLWPNIYKLAGWK